MEIPEDKVPGALSIPLGLCGVSVRDAHPYLNGVGGSSWSPGSPSTPRPPGLDCPMHWTDSEVDDQARAGPPKMH